MSLKSFAHRVFRFGRKALKKLPGAGKDIVATPYSAFELEGAIATGSIGSLNIPLTRFDEKALEERRFLLPRFVTHTAYEPPPEDAVFVSVCNDKYEPGLEAVILSLRRIYPHLKNRYIVYHDSGLSEFSRQRLSSLYPQFEFVESDPAEFQVKFGDHYNHQRVGALGYLSLHAIKLEEPSHVIILDSDLLILGDISPLWSGDAIKAVPDIGLRPFGIVSAVTGHPVINSGVISLPRAARGAAAWKVAVEILQGLNGYEDSDIAHFADQRFWNIFIPRFKSEVLPQNFNTIKSLVSNYRADLAKVSIMHLTGPKPWYDFILREMLTEDEVRRQTKGRRQNPAAFVLWDHIYGQELLNSRLEHFEKECGAELDSLFSSTERPAVMIGNGPSISRTDLSAFEGYEKFAFNWFVNHEEFSRVRPDHLVVASHMLFGGWHGFRPQLPDKYLEALTRHEHKPRVWFPLYFRPYVESLPQLAEYKKSYYLFEKPFKEPISRHGVPQLDLRKPLVDCNTGVLTIGIPVALHLGSRKIVLVGCDSNYSSTQGSYFYASDKHASQTTKASTLMNTWRQGGEGQYGYTVTARALQERGVEFFDATIDGKLQGLPRLTIEEARALR